MKCPYRKSTTVGNHVTTEHFMECYQYECPFYRPENKSIDPDLFVEEGCNRISREDGK